MRALPRPARAHSEVGRRAVLAGAGLGAVWLAAACSGGSGGFAPGTSASSPAAEGAAATGSATPGSAGASTPSAGASALSPASTPPGGPSSGASESAAPGPLTSADAADAAASAGPGSEPAWLTGDSEQTQYGVAGVETDLRFGTHDGYDRVVIETSGSGTLGWRAQWVDDAYTQGKGDPMTVSGAHTLLVVGLGTSMPTTQGELDIAYTAYGPHTVGGQAVSEVWMDLTFEGQFQIALGTETTEYRILSLSDPTRLVIDVKQP